MLTGALIEDDLASLRRKLSDPNDRCAPSLDGRTRQSRRLQGAYFTPAPLVDFVVRGAVRARMSRGAPTWRTDTEATGTALAERLMASGASDILGSDT